MKENKRFWTYLQHLEAQKHQFALYIKSKNADFPNSLLQQFNFEEAEETATTEESNDTGVGEEIEGESQKDQQPEQKEA